jgi:ketopantoate reductase
MATDLEIDEDNPPRRVVIGQGRIGTALARASGCALISRYRGWYVLEEPAGDPIVVCVRNDDLGGVLTQVPPHRWPDLVFVQNGMIDAWLADHGLAGNTRGVLFFAVPTRGAPIQPGGVSRFTGAHANSLALWLESLGLRAEVLGRRSFNAAMLEKLIWNAAFGLLCQRFDLDVGGVLDHHPDELAALARELGEVGRLALGVDLDDATLLANLRAYASSIPRNRAGLKEWPWRGGWFTAAARSHGLPLRTHTALVAGLANPPA